VKLLLDDNLGFSVLRALAEQGLDAVPLSGPDGRAATDEEVLAEAKASGRILVTMDEGFARVDPAGHHGIVVVSLPDEGSDTRTAEDVYARAADVRRAVLDLATERHLLDDQIRRLDEEVAHLAGEADEAMRDGREDEARGLFLQKAAAERRVEELHHRRDAVRETERTTQAAAEKMGTTADQLRFEQAMAAADELLASVGDFSEEEAAAAAAAAAASGKQAVLRTR
jgi:predicted nuclease of predicted toxin-antitoxin system